MMRSQIVLPIKSELAVKEFESKIFPKIAGNIQKVSWKMGKI